MPNVPPRGKKDEERARAREREKGTTPFEGFKSLRNDRPARGSLVRAVSVTESNPRFFANQRQVLGSLLQFCPLGRVPLKRAKLSVCSGVSMSCVSALFSCLESENPLFVSKGEVSARRG